MPLIKSSSEPAFRSNVAEMIKAGHPRDQALAAAYRVKRQRRAAGGFTNPMSSYVARAEARSLTHSGPIMSMVGGRTDHHPMRVRPGSYVLPADHVSSLGQGNTANGMAVLGRMFSMGPYGSSAMKVTHGRGAPPAPRLRADGGASMDDEADDDGVPIYAAGGEYVIEPEQVEMIGDGDIKRGHAILDHWVTSNRQKHIKTLKKLPGPAKD